MHQIRIQNLPQAFIAEPGETLLRSALRADIAWPYECNTGGCGTCKFELLSGEVEVLRADAPGLSDRDRRKNRHLACQCRASASCEVKLHIDTTERVRDRPERVAAKLVATRAITHDIREFVFAASRPAVFRPGQYALVGLPDAQDTVRAYSMSNLPNEAGAWHFQVRKVPGGRGSEALFALSLGAEVTLDGPYGHAYLREDTDREVVCIAGGSGLAPMISIARAHAESRTLSDRQLHFFYGGRQPRDICGEDMLRALPSWGRTLSYHPVASQARPGEADWSGAVGWVHDIVASSLPRELGSYEYYFAGPPPMAAALLELLQMRNRVALTQIHFDRFF